MSWKPTMGESNRWLKTEKTESWLYMDRISILEGNTEIKEDEHCYKLLTLSPSFSLNFSGSPFLLLHFSFYNPSPLPAVLLFSWIFGVIPVPSACISAILWSWGQTLGVVLPVQASQLAINVANIRWEES